MTDATPVAPTDAEIEALGHRMCWRYKHDTGVNHISTFTFNAQTLHDFAREVLAKWGTPHSAEVSRPTKAQLLSVGPTAELCEVVELGKYWGFRCGHWLPVKVLKLPCARGGTGEIAYAPIDKRGYPYAGGIALRDCQAFWGPVKAWGDKPPKVSRRALLEKGVSESWLRQKKRAHNAGIHRADEDRPAE